MAEILDALRTALVLLSFFACFLVIALPLVWLADFTDEADTLSITVRGKAQR